MVPVLSSATNVVSTVWLLPLIAAVTLVIPAFTLVRVVAAKPWSSVVTVAVVIAAPLSAEKLTVVLGTRLPLASVTVARTLLVSVPLALALSTVIVNAPSTMVLVLSSATKVVSTFWLLPLMVAVTLVIPDLTLVSVVLASPWASVVADAVVTVAPLFAAKVTAVFGTKLPLASVTLA